MTLFQNAHKLLYKIKRMRIWLASAIVIILILLLALTVNNAREKEMAELFGRQQLASAQNAASRMTEIFVQVVKNISLFSYYDPEGKKSFLDDHQQRDLLYHEWEDTVKSAVLLNSEGKVIRRLSSEKNTAFDLTGHFQALKERRTQYVDLAPRETLSTTDALNNEDWYLIWGYPIWRNDYVFSGAWIFSFSLASLVDFCEKQIRDNQLGEMWLLDEQGKILIHPKSFFNGKSIGDVVKFRSGEKFVFPSSRKTHMDVFIPYGNKKQRNILTYYPVRAEEKLMFVLVAAPYSKVIAPVRTTFIYTMLSALVLMVVVVVAAMSFAFREGKLLRIREESERLKEREAWQEKLLREKKTIDGIMEGSPIPAFVINKEHKVILWNRSCQELTGYSAEEMVGTDNHYKPFYSIKRPIVADLIIDNDLEGLNRYYGTKRVKKSEKVRGAYEAFDYFENLGGRSRYLYFLAAPIYDEEGNIIAAIETLQDMSREEELARSLREYAETLQNELTENIELRREIEELYNYMQSIVKSLPDKIYELDENGIVNYVSKGRKKDDGELLHEIKGTHFLEYVAPPDRDFVLSKWEDAKKGIYDPYEITAIAKDGSKRNLLITTAPVIGTNHYILVQRDITELTNLEKKLYDSQKLAALGQLSAGIAHEVRNPLSSIKMSLQILEKRMNPDGNDLKRFKIAQKEVEHLEELVNNVLVFAKPVEPKMASVELTRIIEQAIAMAEKIIADKQIEIKLELQNIPYVNVDAAMITDAFLNIIRNAVEAVGDGGIIRISAKSVSIQPPTVIVVVEDNGCGIDEEDMPHIFNPFFTKKNYGTGLGLSQVLKIVELHHGKIEIISEKNKGTKVCIELPYSERRRVPRKKGSPAADSNA